RCAKMTTMLPEQGPQCRWTHQAQPLVGEPQWDQGFLVPLEISTSQTVGADGRDHATHRASPVTAWLGHSDSQQIAGDSLSRRSAKGGASCSRRYSQSP